MTVPDIGPVEAIRVASEAGYDKVGLRLLPATPEEPAYPLLTDDKICKEALSALADTGLEAGDVELIRIKPESNINNFLPLFERAQQLGATQVIVVNDDENLVRMTDNFAALCDAAAPFNLTLNLEPMPWTALRDLATAAIVIAAAGRQNSGILIDAFHFNRRHTPLTDLEDLDARLLNIFQICDAPLTFNEDQQAIRHEARTSRLIPGEGELDLATLIRNIPATAVVSIEVPNRQLMDRLPPAQRSRLCLESTKKLYAKAAQPNFIADD